MDVLFFLRERLEFSMYFFDHASRPFFDIVVAIEDGQPPYAPKLDAEGEPSFLDERQQAEAGLVSIGVAALSMVTSSLKLFISTWWRSRVAANVQPRNWMTALEKICDHLNLKLEDCPADLELIEQAILARNSSQHPVPLARLGSSYVERDLKKFPIPFFMSDEDRELADMLGGASIWLPPEVYIDKEMLKKIVGEVEKLCSWLDDKYENNVNTSADGDL